MKTRFLLAVAASFGFGASINAADWPQFRGPHRDGISAETGLLKSWPESGPPLVWTYKEAGVGFSGPAVVGDRVYLAGGRGDSEFVFALDVKKGTQLWATKIGPLFTWKGNSWNAGPSATPTVDGDRVYALGGGGELVCVEAKSGKEVWRKSILKDLAGEVDSIGGGQDKVGWGFTWAPLIDADHLICVPGGKDGLVAALDKKTGAVKWRSKQLAEAATYSSPIVAEIDGVRQYIIMTYEGTAAVSAKDGSLLWYYKREKPYRDVSNCVVIPTPVVQGNQVFTSAGWTAGCDLIKVTRAGNKFSAAKVYSNGNLSNENGGFVLLNGYIFGYSNEGKTKGWICLQLTSGRVLGTERRRLRGGSIIAADGLLYLYGEDDGTVVLLEPSIRGVWDEKGRFEIPEKSTIGKPNGKIWTHPVIANGKLYLRDQNLLFCFNVKQ